MAKIDLRNLARLGAEARLKQLDEERAAIVAAFPGIGRTSTPTTRRRRRQARRQKTASTRKARRKMSAAQRKAVSERMKKYWARKRAAKK